MGRARKGVIQLDDGRWTAALPIAVGANRRVQFTDTSEAVVRRWYADGEAALSTHRPPPSPDAYRARKAVQEQQRLGPRLRSAAWWAGATGDDGHLFDKVANAWAEQRYGKLRRAQPERHAAVLAIIGNDLSPWLKSRGVITIQGIENQLVADLATELAGRAAVVSVVAAPWPHLDGRRELAAQEAYSLVGVSRSTVSRWRRDGLLPSWHVDGADGRARVLVTELRAARMAQQTREQVERVGVFSSTAQNKLNVLGHILDFAKANGVQVTGDPMSGITSVKSEAEIAAAKVKTKHLPLGHVRDIAAHLPVVQQLTLWLERILGVRIGEGFGPFVGDVVDFGDVAGGVAGCLVIDKQGGRPFQILDNGVVVRRPSKEALKTSESERVVPLPRQLMTLLRVVLAAFHTDPATGELDMTARLVPGMRVHDESGQQAHRNALDRAVDAAGVHETKYGRIHPHRFRADLITDLERAGVDGVAARRFVGHVAGDDVHEREYMLDPADITPEAMAPFRDIIATLEGLVDSELGGTLMVPTAERETWGRGNRLYPQREHIYATLAAACWYLEPQADDGQPLATTEDVATALDVAPGTARRWMRTGELPGRLVRRDGRATSGA